MVVSVVVPTYNEAGNIAGLIREVLGALEGAGMKGEMVIVDDNSPDGTADLAEALSPGYTVKVLRRPGKMGLGSAVVEGFDMASGDTLVVMDADHSHPPEMVPKLVLELEHADVAVGSRYAEGGGIREDWGIGRRLVSKGATFLARPLTHIKDPMSGMFALDRDVIEGVELNPTGYKILLEILVKGNINTVTEVPFVFQDRRAGESKLGAREFTNYLWHVMRLISVSDSTSSQFIRFAAVGATGVLVNLALLFLLVEYLGLWYMLGAIMAFMTAVTTNYIGNRLWTFRRQVDIGPQAGDIAMQYGQFMFVSIAALIVNLAVLFTFVELVGFWYMIAQFVAILAATVVNFAGNKYWTFRTKRRCPVPAQETE